MEVLGTESEERNAPIDAQSQALYRGTKEEQLVAASGGEIYP